MNFSSPGRIHTNILANDYLAFGDFDHGNSVNFAAKLEGELASANLFLFVEDQVMSGHFHRGRATFVAAEKFKEFCPVFV